MLEIINSYCALTVIIIWIGAFYMVLHRDLMMLQQNSYRPDRYARWAEKSGESTSIARCCYLLATFMLAVQSFPFVASATVAAIVMLWNIVVLARRKYKKPLVFTPRARRIMGVSLCLGFAIVAIVIWLAGLQSGCVAAGALLFLSPLVMLGANLILRPVENRITRKYYNEAASILASMPSLKIIGITGSYGKTSTKHYLHRILSEHFDTVMTPGSFNTTMGVVRTIREYLKPYNEVFIVEMGAKQPGDIREICDLVHPATGIITAVGEQHLESFKTIENVQRTKFELVDALPSDGLAVLNNDFQYVANRKVNNVKALRYAVASTGEADFTVENVNYGRHGSSFTIIGPDGAKIDLTTPLVGECNISNLMAAVIVALKLGVPEQKIRYAVEHMEQVEHRLNMKRTPGGLTIIDDAFNSNPDGSRMALDVLSRMTPGQRIIITPGMIELGEKQAELNRKFGEKIGHSVDIAIVVGHYNREAITEGILSTGFNPEKLFTAETFAEAQNLMISMARHGDTVLYENDLPDTFK